MRKYLSMTLTLNFNLCPYYFSGKVCQVKSPPPPLFVPVKAAVTPPAGQNKPLPGEDPEARMVDSTQTMPVNQFRRATKGTESDTQYYK